MLSLKKKSLVALAIILSVCLIPSTSMLASSVSCYHFIVIFARGSGQSLDDVDFNAFKNEINHIFHGTRYHYSFYELGSSNDGYPAVNVSDLSSITSTYFSGGKAQKYHNSIDKGKSELKAYINKVSRNCPNTKFVLGGYSQGAEVISSSLKDISADKIIYAATFGDPHLYLPEGIGLLPDACFSKNLSNYRVNVPDCHVHEGILGKMNPYQNPSYINKLGAWCNEADFMCGSYFNLFDIMKAHCSYGDGGYMEASEYILRATRSVIKLSSSNSQSTTQSGNTSPSGSSDATDHNPEESGQNSVNNTDESNYYDFPPYYMIPEYGLHIVYDPDEPVLVRRNNLYRNYDIAFIYESTSSNHSLSVNNRTINSILDIIDDGKDIVSFYTIYSEFGKTYIKKIASSSTDSRSSIEHILANAIEGSPLLRYQPHEYLGTNNIAPIDASLPRIIMNYREDINTAVSYYRPEVANNNLNIDIPTYSKTIDLSDGLNAVILNNVLLGITNAHQIVIDNLSPTVENKIMIKNINLNTGIIDYTREIIEPITRSGGDTLINTVKIPNCGFINPIY